MPPVLLRRRCLSENAPSNSTRAHVAGRVKCMCRAHMCSREHAHTRITILQRVYTTALPLRVSRRFCEAHRRRSVQDPVLVPARHGSALRASCYHILSRVYMYELHCEYDMMISGGGMGVLVIVIVIVGVRVRCGVISHHITRVPVHGTARAGGGSGSGSGEASSEQGGGGEGERGGGWWRGEKGE